MHSHTIIVTTTDDIFMEEHEVASYAGLEPFSTSFSFFADLDNFGAFEDFIDFGFLLDFGDFEDFIFFLRWTIKVGISLLDIIIVGANVFGAIVGTREAAVGLSVSSFEYVEYVDTV